MLDELREHSSENVQSYQLCNGSGCGRYTSDVIVLCGTWGRRYCTFTATCFRVY